MSDTSLRLPPQLILRPLPTYAPWTNPPQKLWRWLAADVWHLHACTERWLEFWAVGETWRAPWTDGDPALLRYVGLWVD